MLLLQRQTLNFRVSKEYIGVIVVKTYGKADPKTSRPCD